MPSTHTDITTWGFVLIAVVLLSWIYSVLEQKRRKALAELAAAGGFSFSPEGGSNRDLFRSTRLKVFSQYPDSTKLTNRIDCPPSGGKPGLSYFDCMYIIRGLGSRRANIREFSLYLADFGEQRLPEFELVPKNLNMDVAKAFGFEKGLDLSEFPELASSYFLSGPDPDRLTALLRRGAAKQLQETANLSIECSGRYLAIFVLYSLVSASEVKTYMDGALEIAAGLGAAAAGEMKTL